ncbi:cytochrome c-type biogenesis protein [Vibrio sp. WXL210]|uniref:cytochrome c-type biogenesis protein n=1 Tax=Vibrio sp. WXL210 TaxID=3450709 RepID=UPI003EC7DCF0
MSRSLLTLMATLLLSFSVMASIQVYEFDDPKQEQQFKELGHTLRCPKCQNNTISDSNAELAQDLRQKVYEMTKEGKSKQEIVDYMVARYGNFVTYNPPLTPATAILWLGPLAVIIFGMTMIVYRSRRKPASNSSVNGWDDKREARLQALLDDKDHGEKS